MPRKRFTEEQSIGVLKEAETGVKVPDLCRQHGISDATFYAWRAKYGGLTVSEARRLKVLEDENRCLKQLVAEQVLDLQVLRFVVAKKLVGPKAKRLRVQIVLHQRTYPHAYPRSNPPRRPVAAPPVVALGNASA